MTFRATNQITSDAYIRIKRTASQLKSGCDEYISQLQSSTTDYSRIAGIYSLLSNAETLFQELKSTPGLSEYAKTQEDDPLYDFPAEAAAMEAEVVLAVDWIETNVPLENRTLKPIDQWNNATTLIADTYQPQAISGLVVRLQSVSGTIS